VRCLLPIQASIQASNTEVLLPRGFYWLKCRMPLSPFLLPQFHASIIDLFTKTLARKRSLFPRKLIFLHVNNTSRYSIHTRPILDTITNMCLPCFPFSDVKFEDEPRRNAQGYQYVWDGQAWVLRHVVSVLFFHSVIVCCVLLFFFFASCSLRSVTDANRFFTIFRRGTRLLLSIACARAIG